MSPDRKFSRRGANNSRTIEFTSQKLQPISEGILKPSNKFFRAPFVDLGQDDDEDDSQTPSRDDDEGLVARLDQLEGQANDNLILARRKEEGD
jgi:hypothetical protein